ncbi:MAG: hypothetical protein ABR499_02775 [Gemmatimonadaceae bacterium]
MPRTLDAQASKSLPTVLLILLGMLAAPAVGRSQEGARLTPGARVRLQWMETTRRDRAVGRVLELRADSLALFAGPARVRAFALARLDRIDVRVPRSRVRGAARGAGLGALAGFAVGLAVATASYTGCRGQEMCGIQFIAFPPLGATAGLTLGTVVGAAWPGQRWQRVRPGQLGRER